MSVAGTTKHGIDRVGIGWVIAWSILLSVIVTCVLRYRPPELLSTASQLSVGQALGGLSAAWTLIVTWVFTVDLPIANGDASSSQEARQRIEPRIQLAAIWMLLASIFAWLNWDEPVILAQLFLTMLVGVTGPAIVTQWTRHRISRGGATSSARRSIRQMLGLATTIGCVIASVQAIQRTHQLPSAVTATIVGNAILWLMMMLLMLGRWRTPALLTIPLVAAQWISISLFVEYQDRNNELQELRVEGMITGFFFFAALFLALLRSGGHRWTPFTLRLPWMQNKH